MAAGTLTFPQRCLPSLHRRSHPCPQEDCICRCSFDARLPCSVEPAFNGETLGVSLAGKAWANTWLQVTGVALLACRPSKLAKALGMYLPSKQCVHFLAVPHPPLLTAEPPYWVHSRVRVRVWARTDLQAAPPIAMRGHCRCRPCRCGRCAPGWQIGGWTPAALAPLWRRAWRRRLRGSRQQPKQRRPARHGDVRCVALRCVPPELVAAEGCRGC
jgi:hypothetical protein